MVFFRFLVIVLEILVLNVIFRLEVESFNGGPFSSQERIVSEGYPLEEHFILTEDQWLLNTLRIPYGRDSKSEFFPYEKRPVCFLQHGFVDSSGGWILNTPEESLAFILADSGCDVWLGNSRGNSYSNVSLLFHENESRYWDFSFDEFAKFDFPAQIRYVQRVTGVQNLSYVGVSQGTTMAFAAFSSDPSLAKSVNLFIALAPIAYMDNVQSSLLRFLADMNFDQLLELLGINKFYPSLEAFQKMVPELCKSPKLCECLFQLIDGSSPNLNHSTAAEEIYLATEPDWTSSKEVIHYAQLIRSGKFEMFDFGTQGNIEHYNTSKPPAYNLQNIRVPIALFYGELDELADPTDVAHLLAELPPSSIVHVEEIPHYGHRDFNWSIDAYKVIYQTIVKMILSTV